MAKKISKSVYYTGKVDWELRKFHGEQLSTSRGSSYNSFLIKDKKNILIDSVHKPFTKDFIENIRSEIELKDLDAVVVLHSEPDHSGGLPHLLAALPGIPVYCSRNGMKALKGHYHKDWNFQIVKSGDKISTGSQDLVFIEAKMMHWPDTMMCYLDKELVLFSSDVFGQHFASDLLLDSSVNEYELFYEAMKYYANIITPYSDKSYEKLTEILNLNLHFKMICPAHGVIFKEKTGKIIDEYKKWTSGYKEELITVIYDSMYSSTRKMAEAIASGIRTEQPEVEIKIYNSSKTDRSDLITEIFRSKAFVIGSPTYNKGTLSSTASLLDEIRGMKLKNKKGASFTSYGWSPLAHRVINESLENSGIEVVGNGMKCQWAPDSKAVEDCIKYGKEIAAKF